MFSEKVKEARKGREQEHITRLAELIKKADTQDPYELAKYLADNGVCDKIERRKREDIIELISGVD